MKKVYIAGIGGYVPPRSVSNDQLAETLDTSDEWIARHTGIRSRHLVDEETTSDLAVAAAEQALSNAGIEANDLGMIILATSTPDFACLPATANNIQERLGAMHAGAFDLVAACAGFSYGLEVARGFVQNLGCPTLLIGAERMSSIVDWNDRNTCILFGDGAGAAVLMPSETSSDIIGSHLRSEGSGLEHLSRQGNLDIDQKTKTIPPHGPLKMNGRAVFSFAVRAISDTIVYLLETHGYTFKDLTRIVAHQANSRILDSAAKRLNLPEDLFYRNIATVGNTSSASIPLALSHMKDEDELKRGDLVITVGFGAGLTYAGNLIRW